MQADDGEKPTARAITEHIKKLQKAVNNDNLGTPRASGRTPLGRDFNASAVKSPRSVSHKDATGSSVCLLRFILLSVTGAPEH